MVVLNKKMADFVDELLPEQSEKLLPSWRKDYSEARGHAGACLRLLQDARSKARCAGVEEAEVLERLEREAMTLFTRLHAWENDGCFMDIFKEENDEAG